MVRPLDEWGAAQRSHREIARWVAEQQGVEPLALERPGRRRELRARPSLRAVGQKPDGFAITASKTVAVPVERLYEAFIDESLRERWLPDGKLGERTATKPRSARLDWDKGQTRVNVSFNAKDEAKSTVALEHVRLADAEKAERMKAFWRGRLTALKSHVEGGGLDA